MNRTTLRDDGQLAWTALGSDVETDGDAWASRAICVDAAAP